MKRITANQYQTSERYYKLPKILFEDEKYMDMKLEVKVAYSILKDRLELSLSRGWIDEEGAVYLVFSNSKLMKLLGCSKSKLLSIKKILKEYDLIDEVQQSSSEKGRLANKIYLGELSSTPVGNSNRPSVKKRLGQVENETAPVSHSAPRETEVSETKYSETDSLFIEDEEDRNTQPILKRKVEKVTKYDRDYIWGLVQDQFRREGQTTNSETLKTLGNLNPSKSGMSGKVYYSEGLAPTLVRGKGEGFKVAIPCMTPDRLDKRQNGRRFKENQEPMFTLNTQDRHGIVVVGDLPTSFKETGRVYGSEGLSPTLTTMQGGDKIPKILIPEPIQFLKVREATKKGYAQAEIGDSINLERPSSQYRRGRVGKGIANTLTTSGQMGVVVASYEGEDKQVYHVAGVLIDGQFYRLRIRRITPKECFRLQGFPDWAFEAARKVSSNSQLYKQAGNSVTVPVIAAIAKKLKEIEEKDESAK